MITLKKSVVVFDVDGTLISSAKLVEDSLMETLKNYDSKIKTREDIKKFYGPDEVGMLRGLLKNPTLADNAFKEYLQHYEENDLTYIPKLIPGIGELLRELDTRRTLRLGCVTGRTKESLDITGKRLNFLRFFEDIEVESPKGVNKAETIKVLMRKFGLFIYVWLIPMILLYIGLLLRPLKLFIFKSVDFLYLLLELFFG